MLTHTVCLMGSQHTEGTSARKLPPGSHADIHREQLDAVRPEGRPELILVERDARDERHEAPAAETTAAETTTDAPDPWAPVGEGRIAVEEGRHLAWLEFGDPEGRPVLWFHGTPGSADEAVLTSVAAREHGLRVISPSRPGMGGSTRHPGRRVADWAFDVATLADHLGLDRFTVIGMSGGGPHALACAARLGDRLSGVGLISPAGLPEGQTPPWLLSSSLLSLSVPAVPELLLRWSLARDPDFAELPDHVRRALARSVVAGGTRAGREESVLIEHGPWGFEPHRITYPGIRIWQGRQDTSVTPASTRRLASHLVRPVLQEFPDDHHHNIYPRRVAQVMEWAAARER